MAKTIKGTTKRFGARYGIKVRVNVEKIESILRQKHKCPYCNAFAVKRIAVGIWHCRKCDSHFTGRAYHPGKSSIEKPQEPLITPIPNSEKQSNTANNIKEE